MKQFNNISLVHKSLSGALSTEERAAYNNWLLEAENEQLAQDLQDVWDLSANYQPTSFQPNASAAFHKFKAEISKDIVINEPKIVRMKPLFWVTRIAASMILIAACLFAFKDSFKSNQFENEIFASALTNSTLDDGSQIWMDENASMALSTDFNDDERRVKLNGKAYFDIERNEAKPFIVEMGNNRLEVLGTSFNIDNSSDDVIVEVESGIVKVKADSKEAVLKAGDKAVINYKKDQITLSKSSESDFDWIQGSLKIQALPIEKAMERIAAYYNVELDLSVNVDRSCKVTSPLAKNSSIDELFEVLASTYQMKYEKINSKHFEIKYLNCK